MAGRGASKGNRRDEGDERDESEAVAHLVARTRRQLWLAAARSLEPSGESIFTWRVLSHLVRSGPSTQRDLAEAIGQHAAGISRLVDEMARGGLVRRERDREDRRRVWVEVTPAGRRRMRAGRVAVRAALDAALSPLSSAERRSLRGLLERVVDAGERPASPARE